MLKALHDRKREDGFTLIELMVVVLIIAILVAIAVPTFLGARERSQDKAVQSELRNALTAAKVLYTDSQDYSALTEADLEAVEPSLDFAAGVTATEVTTDTVGFNGASTTSVIFIGESAAGDYFCIADDVSSGGGTTFDSSGTLADVDTVAECDQSAW